MSSPKKKSRAARRYRRAAAALRERNLRQLLAGKRSRVMPVAAWLRRITR